MHRACLFVLSLGFALVLYGCSGSPQEGPNPEQKAALDSQEWTWLQSAKKELDGKRQELYQVRDLLIGKKTAGPNGALVSLGKAELESHHKTLNQELNQRAEEFGKRLAEFINNQGLTVGTELNAIQKEAMRMNSDEAIATARDYIDEGGDYQRAVDIYQQAQTNDPDYDKLKSAIAYAEEMRFMTADRFAAAKEKMSQDEVRVALGPVFLRNIKEYPERNVVAWFYRKADGGAAAIWFREQKKGDGNWRVYKTNFDEIKQQVVDGSAGG